MIRKITILGLLVLILNACEKKEISLYPNFEESVTFDIKTHGFEVYEKIYASDISNSVNDAVEEGESIEQVVLEGLWFEVEKNDANTAESITVELKIRKSGASEYLYILDDYTFDIKDGKVVFLNSLKEEGVKELKEQINKIAKGQGFEDIELKAEGEVAPEGSVVDVTVKMFVNATVVYKTEVGM
nr:hypothetical protein [uncultured Carboxylicivirga sp.]